jgi:homogentisate 1,2-dioxygenase
MPHYRRMGDVPRKRHILVPADGGGHVHEELMGTNGFSAAAALLYHRCSPSALVAVEAVDPPFVEDGAHDHPLVPRHFRTGELPIGSDVVTARQPLLVNGQVTIGFVTATEESPLYRNAAGDELVYIHDGNARLDSVFGSLDVQAGDFVVIPAGTTHRWTLAGRSPLSALAIEARGGHVDVPRRYLSDRGQMVEGAPFSERDIRSPDRLLLEDGAEVPVLVRHRGGWSRHVHRTHPFDVVGWDGGLYPWAFSIHDFEPLVGTLHQPPPIHQTFEGPGFVVCSFTPRLYDLHPDAVKVPYHHANVDSDEVLFYADGDFMSRAGSGIGVGSLSFHPAGFVHGPQPGSLERSMDQDRTDELAVMVDTFDRLRVTDAARAISDDAYAMSWGRTTAR